MRMLSWLTVSRWAMDAYGTTVNLGRLPPAGREPEFAHTQAHLLETWQILGAYAGICFLFACALLALRDDER
jgi:hypothetical protein